MNESHIIQLDHLNAEHRILKARYEHRGQQMRQLIKWIFLSPLLGIAIGAFGMIYFELPKPQPVVHVEKHIQPAMNDQRVKELRFALQKLERLKDVHEATLREAATNQGEIQQMVERLGVEK